MRIGFSGPRLFGGLIRPWISFGPRDFRRRAPPRGSPSSAAGYVYVIRNGESGCVKLGSSIQPVKRLAQLQTGSPHRLELVSMIPVAIDATAVEFEAHALLDRHRMNGEWFAVSPELAVSAIYAAADRLSVSLLARPEEDRSGRWLGITIWLSFLAFIGWSAVTGR